MKDELSQLYRVCYFEDFWNIKGKERRIFKEFPLSFRVAILRQEFLEKMITGYVWLEMIEEEKNGSI
ncbi:MAG: hypothetical protein ACRCZI_00800 [Cetobacterium sp.]